MYLEYFGLDTDPFTISPDPSFLYPSPPHRQALAHLKYGLHREGGFILLHGEVGTGKTTLTRLLLQQLPGNIRVAYVLNARLGELDLLTSICQELQVDIDLKQPSVREYTDLLNRDLLDAHASGKKTLVVIEEAQNLDPEVLEMLRLLTNLETNTTKLLHILLVAQPEILEKIGRPELRQLNQRIVARYQLQPLSRADVSNYVRHRMSRAGCSRPVFDRLSIIELHELSGGIPRLINLIAERALIGAYGSDNFAVTKQIVKNAADEVMGKTEKKADLQLTNLWKKMVIPGSVAVIALIGILLFVFGREQQSQPESPVDVVEETPVIEPVVQRDNAYTALLKLWSIDQTANRESELCSVAESVGLLCEQLQNLSLDQLFDFKYPGLLRLQDSGDSASLYFVSDYISPTNELVSPATPSASSSLNIANANTERRVTAPELAGLWDGRLMYLWRPPAGYNGLLKVGEKNHQLVDWLQDGLRRVNADYEPLISGGIYSAAISEEVKRFQSGNGILADGVLGPATIRLLSAQVNEAPPVTQ